MPLASDLIGLGAGSPLLAARTAIGGTGPLTITPAGTTLAAGTKIGATQFLVTVQASVCVTGAQALVLPSINNGDGGAWLADDYIINNQGTTSIFVFTNVTGVGISCQGSNNSKQILAPHATMTLYPVQATAGGSTTANWIGTVGN